MVEYVYLCLCDIILISFLCKLVVFMCVHGLISVFKTMLSEG
jgi:hypothetical protein